MGQFAQKVATVERKLCIVARQIEAEFDDDDVAEFTRLARSRKWRVIELSVDAGAIAVRKHGTGLCCCPDDTPGKGVTGG